MDKLKYPPPSLISFCARGRSCPHYRQAFDGKKNHAYAKLLPEGVGNGELMAEGEGALSLGAGDKR